MPLGGSPPIELLFEHATFHGGVEGGYAQIDDIELVCGPVLFADGFDSGWTTHWSADVPWRVVGELAFAAVPWARDGMEM